MMSFASEDMSSSMHASMSKSFDAITVGRHGLLDSSRYNVMPSVSRREGFASQQSQ
jgi:hypothetical protein